MSEPKRILIIDDEPATLEFHIRDLKERGFQVFLAPDTTSALRYCLREEPGSTFEAIVVDMMMPAGDVIDLRDVRQGLSTGAFLLGKFREHEHDCPVLIITNLRIDEVFVFMRERFDRLRNLPEDESAAMGELWSKLLVQIQEKRRMPWFRLGPHLEGMIRRESPRELA